MLPLRSVVEKATEWTAFDSQGVKWTTRIHDLHLSAAFKARDLKLSGRARDAADLEWIVLSLDGVRQELQGILVSWHRLDWVKRLHAQKAIDDPTFMLYAASDIDLFHVRLRSAFDYLAPVGWGTAVRRECVGGKKSFEDLVTWAEENSGRLELLGPAAVLLLDHEKWFRGLRELRDFMVHNRGFTLVLPGDGIGFMTIRHGGGVPDFEACLPPGVMQSAGVADFRRYACAHLCWFIHLAEQLATLLQERWELAPKLEIRHGGGGVETFRSWNEDFRATPATS